MQSKSQSNIRGRLDEFWRSHVEAWRGSGISISAYCRKHAISRDAFIYRRRKCDTAQRSCVPDKPPISIVRVPLQALLQPLEALPSPPTLRLTVAARFHIDVGGDFSAQLLEKLVATLERLA
jgi:hypothetical protein